MVIDTSALVAILFDEPERRAFNEAIEAAASRAMSVATLVELSIVIESRLGAEGLRDLDTFVKRAGIELVPVDLAQADVARQAFHRFGKGRHPAGLNYGDCFSYALASVRDEPLLSKGDDFPRTDLLRVEADPKREPGSSA
jgi:ribonuclease VapC